MDFFKLILIFENIILGLLFFLFVEFFDVILNWVLEERVSFYLFYLILVRCLLNFVNYFVFMFINKIR